MNIRILLLPAVAILLLMGCSKNRGKAPTGPPPPPSTTVIGMVNTSFVPYSVTVTHGDTVLWVNTSPVNHTTTSGPVNMPDGLWHSGNMVPGDSFSVVFGPGGPGIPGRLVHVDTTGVLPYYCVPHAFIPMDGILTVNP